ncbi:glycoside hydrolase family protein [Sporocytophaga myxococcoides]|uniref:Glycoside hydrolase family protein n=1 Tax=Sporocytophaga myxococcoides TaxID=153721 RepID=A0A098L9A8_9BACT|nr:PA14 domain-containing protein [Sporocytophaga myxococcoides]GAL83486.1 glycoside hydrolase family protein [Sporocytophaga myxococcoides]
MLPDFSLETPLWKGAVIRSFNTSFDHTADSFAVKYYGYIDVPADGEYIFYTNSDDRTKLYIGNQLVVLNNGIHGMTEQSGNILLKKGKHAIALEYFERNSGDGLEVSYSGPSISKQIIPSSILYIPSMRDPENPVGFAVNGLDYKFYTGTYTILPDFNSLVINKSGRINQFNLTIPERTSSNLAVRYVGYINIPSDGIYTFYTSSDDGSKLYIGSTIVVSNDGIHGMIEAQGSIGLKKGKHAIVLEYFQGTGVLDLK